MAGLFVVRYARVSLRRYSSIYFRKKRLTKTLNLSGNLPLNCSIDLFQFIVFNNGKFVAHFDGYRERLSCLSGAYASR